MKFRTSVKIWNVELLCIELKTNKLDILLSEENPLNINGFEPLFSKSKVNQGTLININNIENVYINKKISERL